ncbi:hypothetical protein BD410DRAFT_846879 [Rickenella mellea]|uniref:Uncharacterized protein n=1 Tax=Rickenella mellea TaxID=50990 RepID=A0A4Y7PE07_9AGAM|nr:hypothetical protein BD410DRAFT_846879 [Rickenella mellea]
MPGFRFPEFAVADYPVYVADAGISKSSLALNEGELVSAAELDRMQLANPKHADFAKLVTSLPPNTNFESDDATTPGDTIFVTSSPQGTDFDATPRCQVCLDASAHKILRCGNLECKAYICVRGGPNGWDSGCLEFEDVQELLTRSAERRAFRCLRCSAREGVPFPYIVTSEHVYANRVVIMNKPVLLTGLRYKDCAKSSIYEVTAQLMGGSSTAPRHSR